jgi:small redox-active disulfide protein 2
MGGIKMELKILGSGCKKCEELTKNAEIAVKEDGIEATIVKETDFRKIMGYGVMSTPALVIDEKVVSTGKVLKTSEIKDLLKKYV